MFHHDDRDDCILWHLSLDSNGYGQKMVKGRLHRAHRLVLQELHVPIAGMVVRHICDNRACVNPNHLTVGTQADNVRDMLDRHRHPEQIKTHCVHGHPFDEANTLMYRGRRLCRACARERDRRWRHKQQERTRVQP